MADTEMADTGFGASVRRREDPRFLTGRGRYVDDINRPGQLHAYFLRSPFAHARLVSIDTSAAAQAPAVAATSAAKSESSRSLPSPSA